jgi:hypothetical protein
MPSIQLLGLRRWQFGTQEPLTGFPKEKIFHCFSRCFPLQSSCWRSYCHCSKINLNSVWTKETLDCFYQTFTWFVHSQNSCLLSNSWNLQIACSQNWTVAAQVHLLSYLLFWSVYILVILPWKWCTLIYRKLIRDQLLVYYGTWRFIILISLPFSEFITTLFVL